MPCKRRDRHAGSAVVSPPSIFHSGGCTSQHPLIPREGGVFVSLLSVICEIIQTGVAVSALLLEVSERIGKKKGKDDREK